VFKNWPSLWDTNLKWTATLEERRLTANVIAALVIILTLLNIIKYFGKLSLFLLPFHSPTKTRA
jgi:hypothetical protein